MKMKNVTLLLALFTIFMKSDVKAVVFWGSTFVIPHVYGCDQEYVEVGFYTNGEINNNRFDFLRSTDPNFSVYTYVGNQLHGCGTCSGTVYSVNDLGPFIPGQIYYYRARATSNSLNISQHDLGTYINYSSSTFDWKYQVASSVEISATSNDPNNYTWQELSSNTQGVNIDLFPTEVATIYLQQYDSKINFVQPPSFFINSLDVNIDNSGYINLHQGSGVQNVLWNSLGSLNSSIGVHNLQVKFIIGVSSQIFFREYNVQVIPSSTKLFRSNNCDIMRLYESPSSPDGIPLVLSEGYDAYNIKTPEFYRYVGNNLFNCLINKGFKIYVVNYKYNSQDIRSNAAIYNSAVKYISSINNNIDIVAAGMSMGGVITRYALAKAENDGDPLPVSTFLSIDAPQQGSIVSRTLQNFKEDKQSGLPNSGFLLHSLTSTASRQLLLYNSIENTAQNNEGYETFISPTHTTFYSELNNLNGNGYPHLTKNIGVSFSSPIDHTATGMWLKLQAVHPLYQFNIATFNLTNEEIQAGSYLSEGSTAVDNETIIIQTQFLKWTTNFLQPFNTVDVVTTRFENPTFIPHSSSLDITNGQSKFDVVIYPTITTAHDIVPYEIIEPLINKLIKENVYLQNKIIINTRSYIAGKSIVVGNNVTTSEPPGDFIVASGSNVTMKAGQEIILKDGFVTEAGSEFHAFIGIVECDGIDATQMKKKADDPINNNTTSNNNVSKKQSQNYVTSNKNDSLFNFDIYPNPTTGQITVQHSATVKLLQVYDMTGKLVLSANTKSRNKTQMDLSPLSAGIYFLRADGQSVKKIVKQ